MDLTTSPHIGLVVYVANFATIDKKIRFKQAEIEAVFAGFVDEQSQQTNVPDQADPNQARIVLGNETRSLHFSQLACQLQMDFASRKLSFEAQLEVISKNITEFSHRLEKILGPDQLSNSGVVYDISFPSTAPIAELHEYLFDRFVKTPKLGKIAAAQFNVGFEVDGLYLNFAGSVYESRKFEVKAGAPQVQAIVELMKLPVVEYGIQFKIDANDRPRHFGSEGKFTPPIELLKTAQNFIHTQFEDISGLQLWKR